MNECCFCSAESQLPLRFSSLSHNLCDICMILLYIFSDVTSLWKLGFVLFVKNLQRKWCKPECWPMLSFNSFWCTEEHCNSHTSPRSFIGQSLWSNDHTFIHERCQFESLGCAEKILNIWLCNTKPIDQRSLSGCIL